MIATAALALAACTPPASEQATPPTPPPVASADAATAELLAAATPIITEEFGQPISLAPTTVRIQDDWAWLVAQPQAPSGGEIDWTTTPFASAVEHGAFDGNGTTYVLLRRENGAWRIVDHTIGPTDVAWVDWPQRYGAPASVMDLGQ